MHNKYNIKLIEDAPTGQRDNGDLKEIKNFLSEDIIANALIIIKKRRQKYWSDQDGEALGRLSVRMMRRLRRIENDEDQGEAGQETLEEISRLEAELAELAKEKKKERGEQEEGEDPHEPSPATRKVLDYWTRQYYLELKHERYNMFPHTLRPGENQDGPLSDAALRELRRDLFGVRLEEMPPEWLDEEQRRYRFCKHIHLDKPRFDNEGSPMEPSAVVDELVHSCSQGPANENLGWVEEALHDVNISERARLSALAFLKIARVGVAPKNLTELGVMLKQNRNTTEACKKEIARVLGLQPEFHVGREKVKNFGGRAAKLLK